MPQPWLVLPLPPSDNAAHHIVTPRSRFNTAQAIPSRGAIPSATPEDYLEETQKTKPRMVSVPSVAMKDYLEEAQWHIKAWIPQAHWTFPDPHTKIVLAFWIYWPDRRVRDPGNLIKVLGDACKGVLLPDDNMLLPRPMDFTVDRRHPRLACRVWVHRAIKIRHVSVIRSLKSTTPA